MRKKNHISFAGILFMLAGILIILNGCAKSLPMRTGLEPHRIDSGLTGEEREPYVVVDIISNEIATDGYEPYPAQPVVVWQPPEEPILVRSRKTVVDELFKALMAIKDKESQEYRLVSKKYQEAVDNYRIVYNSWALTASPNETQEYRAVSIRFKDQRGKIIEPFQNGKIVISPQVFAGITPYYGGEKRIIIPRTTLAKLVAGGYRMGVTTNDDSDQKHVFGLDGRGFGGEEEGTRKSSFSWVNHGVPFTADNPRIYEVRPGSEKFQEIIKWQDKQLELGKIVMFKKDAVELGIHPGLKEFRAFALNPWDKRYIERKTSRLHAIWQVMGDWEIGPVFFTDFSSLTAGIGIWKAFGFYNAIFGKKQFFLFGSAGQAVTRFDFYRELHKVEKRDNAYLTANTLVIKHNQLGSEYYQAISAGDVERAVQLLKQMAEIAKEIIDEMGYLPTNTAEPGSLIKGSPIVSGSNATADAWNKAFKEAGIKP